MSLQVVNPYNNKIITSIKETKKTEIQKYVWLDSRCIRRFGIHKFPHIYQHIYDDHNNDSTDVETPTVEMSDMSVI